MRRLRPRCPATRTFSAALATALVVLALTAGTSSAAVLYGNNYSDKSIAALSIGGDGLLSPLAGSPFATPHYIAGLAISPDGRTMISSFSFEDQIGALSLAADGTPSLVGTIPDPVLFDVPAITPDGGFAYMASSSGGVHAYAIAPGSSLTKIGTFSVGEVQSPAITPDGRFLLLASFGSDSIERLAIQADGTLVPLGPTPVGHEEPLHVRITPNGRYALVLSNSSAGEDDLRTLAIDTDGSLTPTGFSLPTTGAVTSYPLISPNGRFAYLPDGNEESITGYSIGPNGELSQIGAPFPAGLPSPRTLGMSVDGRFLYVSPGAGEMVQAFSVGPDGALSKIGGPTPTGGESDGGVLVARPAVPTAVFSTSSRAPKERVPFSAGASHDAGSTITSYTWDFGDGTKHVTSDPLTEHVFNEAGVYDVKLTVGDAAGCSGFVFTGQTAYCNARDATTSLKFDTLPVIYGLTARNVKWMPMKKHRASASASKRIRGPRQASELQSIELHFKLSEDAKVEFLVERKLNGRKVKGICRPITKANKGKRRCVRHHRVNSFKVNGKAGKNRHRFIARVKGKALPLGRYLATAFPTDSAGGQGAPRSTSFRIKRPSAERSANR